MPAAPSSLSSVIATHLTLVRLLPRYEFFKDPLGVVETSEPIQCDGPVAEVVHVVACRVFSVGLRAGFRGCLVVLHQIVYVDDVVDNVGVRRIESCAGLEAGDRLGVLLLPIVGMR